MYKLHTCETLRKAWVRHPADTSVQPKIPVESEPPRIRPCPDATIYARYSATQRRRKTKKTKNCKSRGHDNASPIFYRTTRTIPTYTQGLQAERQVFRELHRSAAELPTTLNYTSFSPTRSISYTTCARVANHRHRHLECPSRRSGKLHAGFVTWRC